MAGCDEVICPVCVKPMRNFMMQLSRQHSGEGEDREMTHWKGIVKCCGSVFTIFND